MEAQALRDARLTGAAVVPSATRGAISELVVAADLLRRGCAVFRALSAACPCDLALLADGALVAVEVRTASRSRGGALTCDGANRADLLAIVERVPGAADVVHYLPVTDRARGLGLPPAPLERLTARGVHRPSRFVLCRGGCGRSLPVEARSRPKCAECTERDEARRTDDIADKADRRRRDAETLPPTGMALDCLRADPEEPLPGATSYHAGYPR